jgi:hypothetical protein
LERALKRLNGDAGQRSSLFIDRLFRALRWPIRDIGSKFSAIQGAPAAPGGVLAQLSKLAWP